MCSILRLFVIVLHHLNKCTYFESTMNAVTHKNILYKVCIISVLALVMLIFINLYQKKLRDVVIINQIDQIEMQISSSVLIYQACSGAPYWDILVKEGFMTLDKSKEEQLICLDADEFYNWVVGFAVEPELSEVKKTLLILADEILDFQVQMVVENNYELDIRNRAERIIPLRVTEIREQILNVKKTYKIQ